MKIKALLLKDFVIAGVVYALGYWLSKVYGLDPPYIYLWVGMALQLVLAPVIVMVTLVKVILIHRKNRSK